MLAAGVATWRAWRERGGAHAGSGLRPQPRGVHRAGVRRLARLPRGGGAGALSRRRRCRRRCPKAAAPWPRSSGSTTKRCSRCVARPRATAVVEPVNYNSPGQVVIAGDAAAVQRAIEAARTRGAKRAVTLPVSVPAHSQPDARGRRAAAQRGWQRSKCVRRRIALRERGGCQCARGSAGDPRAAGASAVESGALDADAEGAVQRGRGTGHRVRSGTGCSPALNRRIERRAGLSFLALEDPQSLAAALAATGGT